MSDVMAPDTCCQLEQRKVMLRRDDILPKPAADVAVPTAEMLCDDSGAPEGLDDVADGVLAHGSGKMATQLTQGKRVPAKIAERQRAVGRRVMALRHALDMGTMPQAAARLGVERTRWANWEAGRGMPPPHVMLDLVEIYPDICLHWLYTGLEARLPQWLAQQLRQWEEGPDEP